MTQKRCKKYANCIKVSVNYQQNRKHLKLCNLNTSDGEIPNMPITHKIIIMINKVEQSYYLKLTLTKIT